MISIQNLILQLIPGSSSVALPYQHGLDDHRAAAASGALMMQQYVRDYVASCPKSKIFLMGYSLVRRLGSLCLHTFPLAPLQQWSPLYHNDR